MQLLLCVWVLLSTFPSGPVAPSGSPGFGTPGSGTPQDPVRIVLDDVLAVESLGKRSRAALYTDALEAQRARGEFRWPSEGQTIRSATGEERVWRRFEADEKGWLRGAPFRGGWVFGTLDVPHAGSWRLKLRGPSWAYVDGEPRAGDVYSLGTTRVPLHLEAGPLPLLLRGGRGSMRVVLDPAPAPVYVENLDSTLPDIIRGEVEPLRRAAVLVSNATPDWLRGWRVRTQVQGGPPTSGYLPDIAPQSQRKVAVGVAVIEVPDGDELTLRVDVLEPGGQTVHGEDFRLRIRDGDQTYKRTFRSNIDRSIQYYAVTPPPAAPQEAGSAGAPALVLSLHGASVEARGQAASYQGKPGMVIVAPTNRRPFGFDWEDQGRLDALEVLDHARKKYGTDPRRTYLTGHSMGGHGTWQLGVHFPGRFAVVAPSAGWRDFWSYGGAADWPSDDPLTEVLLRSTNASRTAWLESNLSHAGVYVLHGDADNNVPVAQARFMRERLASFHSNFAYYEQPGAGHWWGNRCVDWPPMFEFMAHNQSPDPKRVLDVDFMTMSPTINSRCHWVHILAQDVWRTPSRATVSLDPKERRLTLDTENVTAMALVLSPLTQGEDAPIAADAPLTLVQGEQELVVEWPVDGTLHLAGGPEAGLAPSAALDLELKGAHRAGPFKEAFAREMVFVYGTSGTPEENAWSFAKARYDHETWRYRGNGQVDMVSDTEFLEWPVKERNLILYGNLDTNQAFEVAIATDAFELRRDRVRVGSYEGEGNDLALLLVYPRLGTQRSLVGIVGGTGMPGLLLTENLPYFVSGVGYPDWTVLGVDMLEQGLAGVRAAGTFGPDWSAGAFAETIAR